MTSRTEKRKCAVNPDKCRLPNGNCPYPGSDSLPVQCVGPWVEDKYYYLNRILKATSSVRKKFYDQNNTVYIDLFSDPGRCIINGEKELGSVFIANNNETLFFNDTIFIDIEEANTSALRDRIRESTNRNILTGDANIIAPLMVKDLLKKEWRYHFAFIDPFGCENLKFSTIRELATLKRMDFLFNFPIGSMKRNISMWKKSVCDTPLDIFLGTRNWRKEIQDRNPIHFYECLSHIYKNQLNELGYPLDRLNAVEIKNTRNVTLYVIIFAAKHHIGQKIWDSIIKIRPSGQRELF